MPIPTGYTEKVFMRRILLDLGIPTNRNGYQMLYIAIPHFVQDPHQAITKELYPYVAERCDHSTPDAVERAIRTTIKDAWLHRDTDIWEQYFPGCTKQPSNKQFIATLAEHLRQKRTPPISRRGRNARRRCQVRAYFLCPILVVSRPVR